MRVLYGVNGEGMGHATRSQVVIDTLLANLQTAKCFPRVHVLERDHVNRAHQVSLTVVGEKRSRGEPDIPTSSIS